MIHTTTQVALLLLAFVLVGCASNAATPVSVVDPLTAGPVRGSQPRAGQTLTLVVHGMGCPLCANNVDKQLLMIAGVRKVDVDLGTGSVTVQYAGAAPTKARLARAVADSGYTLVRVEGI